MRLRLLLSLGLGSLLALSSFARAADEKHAQHEAKAAKYEVEIHHQAKVIDFNNGTDRETLIKALEEGSVDSLKVESTANPIIPEAELFFWSVGIFLVLLFILKKAAWGPILEGLQKREETIRGSVEEAKKTREEMERLRAQFKTEIDQAHAEIPKLMTDARQKAEQMVEEMRTRANEDIATEKQRFRHEMQVAKDQALQELWSQAAHLATLISTKALGRSMTEADHHRLLDEGLRELSQKN